MRVTSNSTNPDPTLFNNILTKSFLDTKIFLIGLAILGTLIAYLYFSYRPSNQLQKKKISKGTGNQTIHKTDTPNPNTSGSKPLRANTRPNLNELSTRLQEHPKKSEALLKTDKAPQTEHMIHTPSNKFRPLITGGKKIALQDYKKDPVKCSGVHKTEIFIDITSIESRQEVEDEIISIVDLLHYMSSSTKIDLEIPLCSSVVLDAIYHCKKSLVEELCQWLILQESLSLKLLNRCLGVFSKLNHDQRPFRIESILFLVKSYQTKSSSTKKFSPEFLSAVKILVAEGPNHDKVLETVAWMMQQKEPFTNENFLDLVRIIKKKEEENQKEYSVKNLYYPLLNQMIKDFKKLKKSDEAINSLLQKNMNDPLLIYLFNKNLEFNN